MVEGNGVGARRYVGVAASVLITLVLVGCGGLGLLPRESDVKNTSFKSYNEVQIAYQQIAPGQTRTGDLAEMGFDSNESPNVEVLSYLGVIEKFLPRDSIRFDALDPTVQKCIEARDRCTGFVFHPERLHKERLGNWFLDILGFQRTTVNYGWSAEIVLLGTKAIDKDVLSTTLRPDQILIDLVHLDKKGRLSQHELYEGICW